MSWLGKPSIADQIDLIAAKDHDTKALIEAFKGFQAAWLTKDGAAMADWLKDWGAFWNRWQHARRLAELEILTAKTNIAPNNQIIAGNYNVILKAFTRTPGHFQKGDFQDLYNRLARAGARVEIGDTPQPTTNDVDRDMFNAADKAGHAIEKIPVIGPLLGSSMQDLGLGREKSDRVTEEQVTRAKWSVAAIGAGLVGVLLLVLRLEK
jgi:hypothetical protein